MRNSVKVVSIALAFVFLTLLAVVAGFGLAVWDTGSSVSEVFGMDKVLSSDPEVGQTQTITILDNNITDFIDKKDDARKANIDRPITDGLADGIKPSENDEDSEDWEALFDELNEDSEDSDDDVEQEREPLRITSEISGISKIVRAGDESDEVENTLPVPTRITETNYSYDPVESYPLPFTEVDNSYFDDALFIGDSRVAGLAMNSGTNATFYAVTSFQLYRYKTFKVVQTPNGKVPIFDVMPYDKFTKIYIKVGLNELGSVTDEPFLEAYTSLINDLRAMQPRAIIYIQAVLPVTQVKSQTDRVHNNDNISKRNENLKSFAELMKCYYVDVGPYFADETGALKAETTADGIHMYSKYMPQWIEALSKTAVIWPPAQ